MPWYFLIQGVRVKFRKFLKYCQATWSYNMSYELKFCGLLEYVRFQKIRPLIKSTGLFKWSSVEIARAHPNLNLQFRGCLRPLWPQMSHISSFSLKYHITIAFVHLRLFRGRFVIGWILLHKQEFCTLSFVLNSPLRLYKLYWGRNNRHGL